METHWIIGAGVAGPVAAMAPPEGGHRRSDRRGAPARPGDVGSTCGVAERLDAHRGYRCPARRDRRASPPAHRPAAVGHVLATSRSGSHSADGTPALTMKRTRLARGLADEAQRRGIVIEGRSSPRARAAARRRSRRRDVRGWVDHHRRPAHRRPMASIRSCAASSTRRRPDGRYVGLTNFGGGRRPAAVRRRTWSPRRGSSPSVDEDSSAPSGRRTATSCGSSTRRGTVDLREERAATSDADWQRWLASLFDGDAGPAAALIRRGASSWPGDSTYDLGHVPVWHRTG